MVVNGQRGGEVRHRFERQPCAGVGDGRHHRGVFLHHPNDKDTGRRDHQVLPRGRDHHHQSGGPAWGRRNQGRQRDDGGGDQLQVQFFQAIDGEGWLHTGDIATRDEDGYFYIVDRKKDLIIASGYNIVPREVEEVLFTHPKVLEAAVVGVPDAKRGETVKAVVVLKDGQTATVDEIRAYCKERLAPYKVPTQVEFAAKLPRTQAGKVLRRVLAEESEP